MRRRDAVGPIIVDAGCIRIASTALLAYADRLEADAARLEAAAWALRDGAPRGVRQAASLVPGAWSVIDAAGSLRRIAAEVRVLADDTARSAERYDATEHALTAHARAAATDRAIRIGAGPGAGHTLGILLDGAMHLVWNAPFPFGSAVPLPIGMRAVGTARLLDGRREVVVRRTEAGVVARAPAGLEDLVAGIPRGGPADGQIRVDRFGDRSVVYIAGTLNAGLPTEEPFDMSSNIIGVRGGQADAERAVRAAMADAGVPPGGEVTFVGHSQGGIVAANLARSGDFRVPVLVTIGAPIGAGAFTADDGTAPLAYALAFDEDPIPRLDGVVSAPPGVRLVTGSSGASLTSLLGDPLAAHGLDGYARLARGADASGDVGMLPLAAVLGPSLVAGSSVSYDASRRSSPPGRPRSTPGGLGSSVSPTRSR